MPRGGVVKLGVLEEAIKQGLDPISDSINRTWAADYGLEEDEFEYLMKEHATVKDLLFRAYELMRELEDERYDS